MTVGVASRSHVFAATKSWLWLDDPLSAPRLFSLFKLRELQIHWPAADSPEDTSRWKIDRDSYPSNSGSFSVGLLDRFCLWS
jgi:hypothetical protein